ncbi:polysaccharide biosynthesis tyrosine autokinase [Chitinolyticbacter albus]|uniref:polysaccharide biosynthesis tyrosine autokinase n=1 Tax=Chitinolyticbacter albus TaxID=2961951 RepID=UPI00210A57E9|nr:polysaccharide biosynthesis tyrosine autokinase [Chitinolyticbacter albus]
MNILDLKEVDEDNTRKLGSVLLSQGKINPMQAEQALVFQKKESVRFGEALVKLGFISEQDLLHAVSSQFSYPYLQLGSANISEELLAAHNPFSVQVESLRSLRSQLILKWTSLGNTSLMLVAHDRDCGASLLLANLAVLFSQLGKRTLIVDANLRQPTQHTLFGIENRLGLSDILAGRATSSVIHQIGELRNLYLLAAGSPAPNPQELLSKQGVSTLVADLGSKYDIVLYDVHPLADIADAQLLAVHVPGVLLVAKQGKSSIKALQNVKTQLAAARSLVIGCVLNEGR